MQFNFGKDTKESIRILSVSGMIIVAFFVLISHLNIIGDVLANIIKAIAPFIFGAFFCFLLLPLRDICEKRWLKNSKLSDKARRRVSVAVSMVFMVFLLVGFFWLLIPQLVSSLTMFANNLSRYVAKIQELVSSLTGNNGEMAESINDMISTFADSMGKWLTGASGGISKIMDYITSVIAVILNFLIGLIIAMYILTDTEKFKLQVKKLLYALLPVRAADNTVYVMKLTAGMFYKFIFGKAVDSLIIGIICYVVCMMMRMPYSVLIAVVVGITNMIPVFGPFIGAIPCLLILVMINWVKAFEFLIFIIILQQLDGNIIGPYILGGSVGLPTLWVMFAIIVGGAMFGVAGMFIGVPAFAVIYTLVKDWSRRTLEEKNISFEA